MIEKCVRGLKVMRCVTGHNGRKKVNHKLLCIDFQDRKRNEEN